MHLQNRPGLANNAMKKMMVVLRCAGNAKARRPAHNEQIKEMPQAALFIKSDMFLIKEIGT